MRKVFGILFATATITLTHAQEYRTLHITNLTYPEKQMTLACADDECAKILMKYDEQYDYFADRTVVEATATDRRAKRIKPFGGLNVYGLTEKAIEKTETRFKEAYYGKAIGNGILTIGAAVLDTVVLPIVGISNLAYDKKHDTFENKRAAQRILANLFSDQTSMIVRHKYYEEMTDYLNKVSKKVISQAHQAQIDEEIRKREEGMRAKYGHVFSFKDDLFALKYENCSLNFAEANGHNYIQVYVDGTFKGNYEIEVGMELLYIYLSNIKDSQKCKMRN